MFIIPLREIIGNYNFVPLLLRVEEIIPLREIIGNYNELCKNCMASGIIPLREVIGNYNLTLLILSDYFNYTLERDNRELQLMVSFPSLSAYYTLERDNRELQHVTARIP